MDRGSDLREAQEQVLALLGPTFDPSRATLFSTAPALAVKLRLPELELLREAVARNTLGFDLRVGPDTPLEKHTVTAPPAPRALDTSLPAILVDKARDRDAVGTDWLVAVIDDGVDPSGLLTGKLAGGGRFTADDPFLVAGVEVKAHYGDPALGEPETTTSMSHGTKVASIACGDGAAAGYPDVVGVAPGASVLSLRVSDGVSDALISDVLLALEELFWAHEAGFRAGTSRLAAVNISMGSGLYTDDADCKTKTSYALTGLRVCANLARINAPVVASAGNDGESAKLAFPAVLSNVVSVGSTRDSGKADPGSNWSLHLTTTAPGEYIYGLPDPSGGSVYLGSGTSMAAPHVSGALCLLREIYDAEGFRAGKYMGTLEASSTKTPGLYKTVAPRLDLEDALTQLDTLVSP